MAAPVGRGPLQSSLQNHSELVLRLQNGNTIELIQGDFAGNVQRAMTYLQDFCDKNTVRIKSIGFGYSELQINEKAHEITTPGGIDLKMMLACCGGKASADFPAKL